MVATAARRHRGGGGKKKLNPFAAKSAAATAKEKYPTRAEDFLRGKDPAVAAAAAAAAAATATATVPSNRLAIPRAPRNQSGWGLSSSSGSAAGFGGDLMAGLNERVRGPCISNICARAKRLAWPRVSHTVLLIGGRGMSACRSAPLTSPGGGGARAEHRCGLLC